MFIDGGVTINNGLTIGIKNYISPLSFWTTTQAGGVISNSGKTYSWYAYGSGAYGAGFTGNIISGKVYAEFIMTAQPSNMPTAIGICKITSNNVFYNADAYTMFTGNGGCGLPGSGIAVNGSVTGNGAYAFVVGDVIGVAVDYPNGKIWFSKNNVWISGDPATGTSPSMTFSAGDYYFYTSNYSCFIAGVTGSVDIYPKDTAYSPPSGYVTYG